MSDSMLPISRQRLRWWLRSERAMGLNFVHAPGGALASLIEPAARVSQGRPAQAQTAPARPATRPLQESTNLGPSTTFDHGRAPVVVRPTPPAARPLPVTAPDAPLLPGVPAWPPTEPFASPELSASQKAEALRELNEKFVTGCQKCALSGTRRHTVFGEGNPHARLMFVGEGPGMVEDQTGRPFVGRAGQKLDEMIRAMGFSRDDVFICNVVKCRAFIPPAGKDRPPLPEEVSACMPYLQRQIEIVRPRVMVTLGLSASQSLLGVKESMSRMRGRWRSWRGIPVMPTFHPSYILRNYTTETRRAVWEDLKQVKSALESASA